MDYSIIIVHWNTPDLLKKQLEVLYSSSEAQAKSRSSNVILARPDSDSRLRSNNNIETVVVDNASVSSLSFLKKEFPHVKFIQNEENLGYARACNQGAKLARGEWLLFLNPDVEITTDSIKHLIKSAEERGLDAASPKTGENYEKPLPTPLSLLVEFTPLKYIIPSSLFRKRTLFGGCLLIKKSILNKVGGWDEDFFLWFEDSDLTRRLTDKGYKAGFVETKIKHVGGVSFQKLSEKYNRKIFFTSMQTFADKHFSAFGKFVVSQLNKKYT